MKEWSNVCLFSISDLGTSGEVNVLPLFVLVPYWTPVQMGLGFGDCKECGEGVPL